MTKTKISTSQRGSMLQCDRRWYWGYGERLVAKETPLAWSFGSLWHELLECTYKQMQFLQLNGVYDPCCDLKTVAGMNGESLNSMIDNLLLQWPSPPSYTEFKPVTSPTELAKDMWHRYVDTWLLPYSESRQWEIVAIEQPLDAALPTPTGRKSPRYSYTGIVDLVVKHEGQYLIVEHKTTKDRAMNRERELQLSPQATLYGWMCKQMGIIPKDAPVSLLHSIARKSSPRIPAVTKSGVIEKRPISTTVDIFRNALLDNGQDPADPAYENLIATIAGKQHGNFFHRITTHVSEKDMQVAASEAYNDAKRIQRMNKDAEKGELLFTRNWNACMVPGRSCQYLPMCKFGYSSSEDPSGSQAELLGFKKKDW